MRKCRNFKKKGLVEYKHVQFQLRVYGDLYHIFKSVDTSYTNVIRKAEKPLQDIIPTSQDFLTRVRTLKFLPQLFRVTENQLFLWFSIFTRDLLSCYGDILWEKIFLCAFRSIQLWGSRFYRLNKNFVLCGQIIVGIVIIQIKTLLEKPSTIIRYDILNFIKII